MSFFSARTAIGLDISDHTIEVVLLHRAESKARIITKGRCAVPPGVIVQGRIQNTDIVRTLLEELFDSTQPIKLPHAPLVFGIPESQLFVHMFSLRDVTPKQLDISLPQAMKKAIPIREDDLVYTSRVAAAQEGRTEVFVAATSRSLLTEWQQVLEAIGYPIAVFDLETLAAVRDVFEMPVTSPVCIVDCGARTTNISLFTAQGLRQTRAIATAGEDMTDAIQGVLGVDRAAAEVRKQEQGLAQEGKAARALQQVVDRICTAVGKTLSQFESMSGQRVTDVVYIGGSAQLPGLVEYAAGVLGKRVRLGKPRLVTGRDTTLYLEAIGLAWRILDARWKHDPQIMLHAGEAQHLLWGVPRIAWIAVGLVVVVLLSSVLFFLL